MKIESKTFHSKWFEFPDSAGASVLIKEVPTHRVHSMLQGAISFGSKNDVAAKSDFLVELTKSAIVSWSNIEDEDGKSLEVNDDNKERLIEHEGMYVFLQNCMFEVSREAEESREKKRKN